MPGTVLVAEDDEDLAALLELNLQLSGYHVHIAPNGAAALDMVTRVRPDVVLLDVMMPMLDGWQVLRALKENAGTRDIPVIMCTARTEEEDVIRGHLQGAVRYVTKPFDLGNLLESVADALLPPDAEEVRRRRDVVRSLLQRLAELDAGRTGHQSVHLSRLEAPPRTVRPPTATGAEREVIARLTPKQRALAAGLGAGRSARELADELRVSRTNIYAMRKRIARMLRVSPDDVGAEARRLGI